MVNEIMSFIVPNSRKGNQGGPTSAALEDGSTVGVIGAGPAGSFFSYFCLDMAERVGLDIELDLYEPRDFSSAAPRGCNMCGGIVSESLVQTLAAEGIELPPTVVQRGIDSYMLHMDVGSVRIETPLQEKRIASMHRGRGPKASKNFRWSSFDGHLQSLAVQKGARLISESVSEVRWEDGRPAVKTRKGTFRNYDLLVVAAGVNTSALKFFETLHSGYKPPGTTKTFIREYYLGEETVEKVVGNSMHVFLLNLPHIEFAAVIPKGDYVTVCMLGEDITNELVQSFMDAPEVKACLPADLIKDSGSCQCGPRMNVRGSIKPFADRLIFVGDSGVTRLYKDGIGGAYRTAKAAATAAVFQGISEDSLRRYFWPVCRSIRADNSYGRLAFRFTREVQKRRYARRAILRMTALEQKSSGSHRNMSRVLWDVFTGSAPYKEIFQRIMRPRFIVQFMWNLFISFLPYRKPDRRERNCIDSR